MRGPAESRSRCIRQLALHLTSTLPGDVDHGLMGESPGRSTRLMLDFRLPERFDFFFYGRLQPAITGVR